MEIHLMSSCLLLNSRLTPEASTTPQLVHSIGRRCLGTPLSLILGFFVFFGGVESELQEGDFFVTKGQQFSGYQRKTDKRGRGS